jgi:hypothetical protein
VIYRPFRFFSVLGSVLLGFGILIGCRYLYMASIGRGGGHTQSLILAAVLLVSGFQTVLIAFVTDVIAANRKLLEELRFESRRRKL